MKILSATATFGKLSHQTLTFQPGMNVITAPNEWGKSTWCAFIAAMLYGIDTRERTTQSALADKERYAPWSGEPMSGRMDILWNGKAITIERRTKGRSIFGEFKAYETQSGIPVPELDSTNCGQVLLGVEKSVFTRTGFIKLTDLPVAQDETLRRRLNALVTTGDESGASDALEKSLRDLKNKCKFNRSGLIPQAQAQRQQLEDTLQQLTLLQEQSAQAQDALQRQEQTIHSLENHKAALFYNKNRQQAEKLSAAQLQLEQLQQELARQEDAVRALPALESAQQELRQLRQLRDQQDQLHTQARLLPPAPQVPETPRYFMGLSPEDAITQVQADLAKMQTKKGSVSFLGIALSALCVIAGVIGFFLLGKAGIAALVLGILSGGILLWRLLSGNGNAKAVNQTLLQKYAPLSPDQWLSAAQQYKTRQEAYQQALSRDNAVRQNLDAQLSALAQQIARLTDGTGIRAREDHWQSICDQWAAYEKVSREHQRVQELVQALQTPAAQLIPPAFEDTLTLSEADTQQQLYAARDKKEQLQRQLGQLQGQMTLCGNRETLTQQLQQLNERIANLEMTFDALTLAQSTLTQAAQALQRRFAPQITKRTQELFCKLTAQRYDRLSLAADLSVDAGAQGEDTLRNMLWRSDGTADQLYLALRLAVSEALTPDAPIILDDALVRFDDARLALAMEILKETAQRKQVLLFSCQGREAAAHPTAGTAALPQG